MVCSIESRGSLTLVHGIHAISVPHDGLTAAELRLAYRAVLNVGPEARAYVGGNLVDDDWVPEPLARVVFVRDWGRKAAIDLPLETTPRTISPNIRRLCAELSPGQTPMFVRVEPSAEATHGNCVFNVPPHIEQFGGRMILGWCIWEWPGILLNAEFHACWLSPEEELIDITPKPDRERTILFLPDPLLKFDGKPIPSRIEPLSYKREVMEYVGLLRKLVLLKIQGGSETDCFNVLVEIETARVRLIRRMGKKDQR